MARIILNYIAFHDNGAVFNIDILDSFMAVRKLDIEFNFDFGLPPEHASNVSAFNNMCSLMMIGTIDRELTIKFYSSEIREIVNDVLTDIFKRYKVLKDNTIFLIYGS